MKGGGAEASRETKIKSSKQLYEKGAKRPHRPKKVERPSFGHPAHNVNRPEE